MKGWFLQHHWGMPPTEDDNGKPQKWAVGRPNPVPLRLSATRGVLGAHGESWAAAKHCAPKAPGADSAQLLEPPIDGSPRFISWCGWPSPTSLAGAPCQESWRPRHHFSLEGRRRQWEACPERLSSWGDLTCRVGRTLCFSKGKLLRASVLEKRRWRFWHLRNIDFSKCKTITQRTLGMQMPRSTVFSPNKCTYACTHAHVHAHTQTHIESESWRRMRNTGSSSPAERETWKLSAPTLLLVWTWFLFSGIPWSHWPFKK